MNIALLEDETILGRTIQTYLFKLGFDVKWYDNGNTLLHDLDIPYHLYILDVHTPGATGLDCLRKISERYPHIPVIMISASHSVETIEAAFISGGHDYLKKPFHLRELELRINHLTNQTTHTLCHHVRLSPNYIFDKTTQSLLFRGEIQKLTKKETAFINLMISKKNSIINEEDICQYVYNHTFPENVAIRSLVTRLRQKLKEPLIETVHGMGYRFAPSHCPIP